MSCSYEESECVLLYNHVCMIQGCCSVLQRVVHQLWLYDCWYGMTTHELRLYHSNVLQCVAVCCTGTMTVWLLKRKDCTWTTSVWFKCVAMCCSVLQRVAHELCLYDSRVLQCVAVRCSVLQFVAVCCTWTMSVWSKCVAVCCTGESGNVLLYNGFVCVLQYDNVRITLFVMVFGLLRITLSQKSLGTCCFTISSFVCCFITMFVLLEYSFSRRV